MAIAEPEKTESIPITQNLSTKIKNSNQFKSSMIKQYQCNLKIVKEPILKLTVQGEAEKVAQVVASIKAELQELSQEQAGSAKKQPNTSSSSCVAPPASMSTLTGHLDDDDDVIWIRDPYEMFNDKPSTKAKSVAKSDAKSSPAASNQASSSPSVVTPKNGANALLINKSASEDLKHLVNVARKQGYSNEEIDAVLGEIEKELVRPADLLDYLQVGRKTRSMIKESKTLPSLTRNEQSEPMDVGVTPKPDNSSKETKKSSSDKEQTLKEYTAMWSNSTNDDRLTRMNKLISAMPEDQKKSATSQLNKYNNHWSNNHHSNKEESSSEGEDDPDSGGLATSPKSPGKTAELEKLPALGKNKKRKKKKAKTPASGASATLHSPRRFEAKAFTTDDIISVPGHVSFQDRLPTNKPSVNQATAKSPPKPNHQPWQTPNKMIKQSPNSAFRNNRSKSINSRTTGNDNNSNTSHNLLRPFDLTHNLMHPFQFTIPPPSLPANFNPTMMNAVRPSGSFPSIK